jgi:hypothetical protein
MLVVWLALVSCREQAVINGGFEDPLPGVGNEGGAAPPPATGSMGGTGGGAGGPVDARAPAVAPDTRPPLPPDAPRDTGSGGTGGTGGSMTPPPPPPDAAPDPGPPDMGPISRSALLVVGASQLIATDTSVRARLAAQLMVRVVAEADATAADAQGMALVVITSSVTAAGTNTKFRDVAVPLILLEPNLLAPMRLTADTANDRGATQRSETRLAIVADHPLAAGFTGAVPVYEEPWRLTWGVPGPEAIRVATVETEPTQAVIFVYPPASMMVGGRAPAKRLGFFIHDNTTDNLTPQALTLLDAAITWMTE